MPSNNNALLQALMSQSQRQPTALAFNQDRPFDTLASFGPAMASRGANDFNRELAGQQLQQTNAASVAGARSAAEAEMFDTVVKNADKFEPEVMALALMGNPALKRAFGLNSVPNSVGANVVGTSATSERANRSAKSFESAGAGVKNAREGGLATRAPVFNNLLEALQFGPGGTVQATPTRVAAANTPVRITTTTTDSKIKVDPVTKRPYKSATTTKVQGADAPNSAHANSSGIDYGELGRPTARRGSTTIHQTPDGYVVAVNGEVILDDSGQVVTAIKDASGSWVREDRAE